MDINFDYNGVKASNRLEILAAGKLDKLFNKYDFVVHTDVFFRKENTAEADTGNICNIRLSVSGSRLFSEASQASFEAAIAKAVNDLERQLRRHKDKLKTH